MKVVIGVDPGGSGGLAAFYPDGGIKLYGFKTTDYTQAALESIVGWNPEDCTVFFEKVGGYVGVGQPGSAMFNFGNASGIVLGALLARLGKERIRFVTPQVWQKSVPQAAEARKRTKKEALLNGDSMQQANAAAKREGKKALCAEAKRRFPNLPVTMQNCDALLIADYGKSILSP